MLNRTCLWLRSVFLRRRLEREMQEEMNAHLEESAARLMARGMSADDARLAARREFGNVTYLQEEGRYARGTARLDALTADLRFALRQYARKPGTTIVMFVVLVAGMCISTLIFSITHSMIVQPPPGIERDPALVHVRGSQSTGGDVRTSRFLSEEEVAEYARLTDHFAAFAAWTQAGVALDAGTDVDRKGLSAHAKFVTGDYFPVLGVQPLLGPGLPAIAGDDATQAAVAVLGYVAWDRIFGKDPGVIGSTIHVNGVPFTIVGIAPQKFSGILGEVSANHLWLPLSARRQVIPGPAGNFRAAARLKPGVSLSAATAAVQVVAARTIDPADEVDAIDPSTEVVPLRGANSDPSYEEGLLPGIIAMGLLGLVVLLVTCTNVSALLTGLATARRQEIAIRLSLGAARTRLIRQLLTESALLAIVAAAAALGTIALALDVLRNFVARMPIQLEMTWPAAAFTFGVALAVGIAFGVSPALHATRLAVATALRDSTASIAAKRARLQRGLVVAQIAFTQPLTVLLSAALVLAFTELKPDIETEVASRLISLSIPPAFSVYQDSALALQRRIATGRLQTRLEETPGIEAVIADWGNDQDLGAFEVHPDDRGDRAVQSHVQLDMEFASEGHFAMKGIPIIRGRDFRSADHPAPDSLAEVATIIGADLAGRLWGGADPIGRRLRAVEDSLAGPSRLVVVGVIDDPLADASGTPQDYRVFLPADSAGLVGKMLLRTAGDARPFVPTVRAIAQQEIPASVTSVSTVAQNQEKDQKRVRMLTKGVAVAGIAALLLSALGLYAVVAFSVAQRTKEIAIRIAVGASGAHIARKFIVDGLRLSAFGLLIGLPVSLIALRLVLNQPSMPQVSMPWVTAIAGFSIAAVATLAAWLPARRAAAVDPAVTLRRE